MPVIRDLNRKLVVPRAFYKAYARDQAKARELNQIVVKCQDAVKLAFSEKMRVADDLLTLLIDKTAAQGSYRFRLLGNPRMMDPFKKPVALDVYALKKLVNLNVTDTVFDYWKKFHVEMQQSVAGRGKEGGLEFGGREVSTRFILVIDLIERLVAIAISKGWLTHSQEIFSAVNLFVRSLFSPQLEDDQGLAQAGDPASQRVVLHQRVSDKVLGKTFDFPPLAVWLQERRHALFLENFRSYIANDSAFSQHLELLGCVQNNLGDYMSNIIRFIYVELCFDAREMYPAELLQQDVDDSLATAEDDLREAFRTLKISQRKIKVAETALALEGPLAGDTRLKEVLLAFSLKKRKVALPDEERQIARLKALYLLKEKLQVALDYTHDLIRIFEATSWYAISKKAVSIEAYTDNLTTLSQAATGMLHVPAYFPTRGPVRAVIAPYLHIECMSDIPNLAVVIRKLSDPDLINRLDGLLQGTLNNLVVTDRRARACFGEGARPVYLRGISLVDRRRELPRDQHDVDIGGSGGGGASGDGNPEPRETIEPLSLLRVAEAADDSGENDWLSALWF